MLVEVLGEKYCITVLNELYLSSAKFTVVGVDDWYDFPEKRYLSISGIQITILSPLKCRKA